MCSASDWLDERFSRHRALWQQVAPLTQTADLSHDHDHLQRVYRWCLRLAPEADADADLAGAAGLVHDLVAVPKDSAQRASAGELSAQRATAPLRRAGYRAPELERIVAAVTCGPWSAAQPPPSAEGQVLQDADRLDALGAVGIFRTFACAQRLSAGGRGLRLAHGTDPLARQRVADDTRFAVDHFAVKLLQLAQGMHLPGARAEALRRQQVMQDYLHQLERELGA